MPRQARVDVPGQYYHVMSRGIERREIFSCEYDYLDFLERFRVWLKRCGGKCLAWCLMPNHFHFMLLRGERPISELMHHVMTGYAVGYNNRQGRCGHLFQNRYKSIICCDEEYFLEAVPYIHLNPLRGGLVSDLRDLANYPWCGHRALVAGEEDGIMWRNGLLDHYGGGEAGLGRYMVVMEEKATDVEQAKEQVRGGVAHRAEVRKDMLAEILKRTEKAVEEPRRERTELLQEASRLTGVPQEEILRPSRRRAAAKARAIYCCLCSEQGGVKGPELMAELRIHQSGISKLIAKGRELLSVLIGN